MKEQDLPRVDVEGELLRALQRDETSYEQLGLEQEELMRRVRRRIAGTFLSTEYYPHCIAITDDKATLYGLK